MPKGCFSEMDKLLVQAGYRFAIKKRFLRKPLVILEELQITNHSVPVGGTGHFDDYQVQRWIPVQPELALSKLGITLAN